MAVMYEVNDFRNGLKIELDDGYPYSIVFFQHVKPGKGNAFTRTKMRNLVTGNNLERTFKSGEKFKPADLEQKEMQFLYKEGTRYEFMDTTNYEQTYLDEDHMGDEKKFLKDNTLVNILYFKGKAISLELPVFVELKVTRTEPGFKGDTATGTLKAATVETGAEIQVPLFINEGD
ncbi:MAG TPA: elongation factor P, partial [bacterium]|nr:elongation factor P [bacterium]